MKSDRKNAIPPAIFRFQRFFFIKSYRKRSISVSIFGFLRIFTSEPIGKGPFRLPFLDFHRQKISSKPIDKDHSGCHFWIFTVKNFIKTDRKRAIPAAILGFQRNFSSNPIENGHFRLSFLDFTEFFFHQIRSQKDHFGWQKEKWPFRLPFIGFHRNLSSKPIKKGPFRVAFLAHRNFSSNSIVKAPLRLSFLDFTVKNSIKSDRERSISVSIFLDFSEIFIKSDRKRIIPAAILGFYRKKFHQNRSKEEKKMQRPPCFLAYFWHAPLAQLNSASDF